MIDGRKNRIDLDVFPFLKTSLLRGQDAYGMFLLFYRLVAFDGGLYNGLENPIGCSVSSFHLHLKCVFFPPPRSAPCATRAATVTFVKKVSKFRSANVFVNVDSNVVSKSDLLIFYCSRNHGQRIELNRNV